MLRLVSALGLAVVLIWSATAQAAPRPGTTAVYGIHHEDHGDVGEHSVSYAQEGEDLVVLVDNKITVEVLFITVFRYEAKRREVWRDGRMIAYESETHDDGTDIRVSARIAGDKFLIDGPEGRIEAPAGTFPTHPWNQEILSQSFVMDTKTGALLKVMAKEVGRETIQVAGRSIQTVKHQITGDQEREVWFDEDGNWVKLRFYKDGSAITFTLR